MGRIPSYCGTCEPCCQGCCCGEMQLSITHYEANSPGKADTAEYWQVCWNVGATKSPCLTGSASAHGGMKEVRVYVACTGSSCSSGDPDCPACDEATATLVKTLTWGDDTWSENTADVNCMHLHAGEVGPVICLHFIANDDTILTKCLVCTESSSSSSSSSGSSESSGSSSSSSSSSCPLYCVKQYHVDVDCSVTPPTVSSVTLDSSNCYDQATMEGLGWPGGFPPANWVYSATTSACHYTLIKTTVPDCCIVTSPAVAAQGTLTIGVQPTGSVSSQGTVTIGVQVTVGDQLWIGSVAYTFVADGDDDAAGEISIGTDLASGQAAIVAAINGTDGHNTANADATAAAFSGNNCVITATAEGTAGNSVTFSSSFTDTGDNYLDGGGILGGTTWGTDGDMMVIGSVTYTFVQDGNDDAEGEISIGTDLASAQANIVAAINGTDGHNTANPDVTASAFGGGSCVITAIIPGSAGNSLSSYGTFADPVSNFFDAGTLGTTTLGEDAVYGCPEYAAPDAPTVEQAQAALALADKECPQTGIWWELYRVTGYCGHCPGEDQFGTIVRTTECRSPNYYSPSDTWTIESITNEGCWINFLYARHAVNASSSSSGDVYCCSDPPTGVTPELPSVSDITDNCGGCSSNCCRKADGVFDTVNTTSTVTVTVGTQPTLCSACKDRGIGATPRYIRATSMSLPSTVVAVGVNGHASRWRSTGYGSWTMRGYSSIADCNADTNHTHETTGSFTLDVLCADVAPGTILVQIPLADRPYGTFKINAYQKFDGWTFGVPQTDTNACSEIIIGVGGVITVSTCECSSSSSSGGPP